MARRKGVPTRCEFVESLAQFVRESDLATAELESIIEHTGMEGATATNDDRQMQEEEEQEREDDERRREEEENLATNDEYERIIRVNNEQLESLRRTAATVIGLTDNVGILRNNDNAIITTAPTTTTTAMTTTNGADLLG